MRIQFVQDINDKIRGKKKSDIEVFNNWNYPIRLSDNEKSFLLNHISNTKKYCEFGSGGSTFLALLETTIDNVVSIESDRDWLNYLRKWDVIKDNEKNDRLKFLQIDVGKTGDWGVPIEPEKKYLFPNYSLTLFNNGEKYDVIFIDGRFRVACALQTVLHSDKTTKILMHDFNNRPEYHVILHFLDIVDTADTMALFQIKKNYDKDKLYSTYEKYKYIYE